MLEVSSKLEIQLREYWCRARPVVWTSSPREKVKPEKRPKENWVEHRQGVPLEGWLSLTPQVEAETQKPVFLSSKCSPDHI